MKRNGRLRAHALGRNAPLQAQWYRYVTMRISWFIRGVVLAGLEAGGDCRRGGTMKTNTKLHMQPTRPGGWTWTTDRATPVLDLDGAWRWLTWLQAVGVEGGTR